MIPVLLCPRREFGDLTADRSSALWSEIAPVPFLEATAGGAPAQATEVRSAWSESEWRVLFHATDAEAWATITERDGPLYEEETVEIFFDPAGDLGGYFEIEVNPLGTVLDLAFRRSRSGSKGDRAWHCAGLRTLVKKNATAWIVECAIPFASVTNSPPQIGSRWRANFCRIDRPARSPHPRELTAWSPPLRANFHTPERFGIVEFGGGH